MAVQKPLVIDNGTFRDLPTGDTLSLGGSVQINGVTYTWPLANGANQTVLTEDGSGGLAWTTPTGGPPSGAAGPTYLSGTYPDPNVVGLGQKLFWLVEGGKYATLQDAYDAATEGSTIVVGPKATGTWGNVTLAENKTMSIVGLNGPQGKTVKIGAVTFSPSTPSLNINRNEYFFANVLIEGTFASQAVLFSGTGAGRMRFVGCYVNNNSATGDGVVNSNTYAAGGTSSSLYLDNSSVQVVTTTGVALRHSGQYTWIKNRTQIEGGLHAIEQTAGLVEIVGASIVMDGATSTVEMTGTSTMTMGYSTVSNNSNAAGAIGVNINSATATFGSGDATISVGSSVLAAGKAIAGTGTVAYTNIAFSYASTIDGTLTQSVALSTAPWFSTKVKQGISLTAPGSGLLEINASGRLNRYNDAAPTNGQVMIGDTAAGYWKAATLTAGTNIGVTNGAGTISIGLTGAVSAANGGTGQTSYAVGDLLYASAATTVSKLADVATGNALISGGVGVAPSYGKIGLTTHVSGTLPVTNGGTGTSTAFTAGSVVFAGASGVYSQDNANFFWDAANTRLGIGGTPTTYKLEVASSDASLNGVRVGKGPGTGLSNTVLGANVASSLTTGARNVAIGTNGLASDLTGNQNTAVGYFALNSTTGSNNTGLGANAGASLANTSNTTCLGANSSPSSTTVSNEVTVGDNAVTTFRIGTATVTTPPAAAQAGFSVLNANTGSTVAVIAHSANAASAAFVRFYSNGATGTGAAITQAAGGGFPILYSTGSDYRFKQDVEVIDTAEAVNRLLNLRPVRYRFKSQPDGPLVEGFIAHEVQAVVPQAVTHSKDAVDENGNPECQMFDQSHLIPLLTAACQALHTKNQQLEARLAALEAAFAAKP